MKIWKIEYAAATCVSPCVLTKCGSLSKVATRATANSVASPSQCLHRHAFTGEELSTHVQRSLSIFMIENRLLDTHPPLWLPEGQSGGVLIANAKPAMVELSSPRQQPVVPLSQLTRDLQRHVLETYPVPHNVFLRRKSPQHRRMDEDVNHGGVSKVPQTQIQGLTGNTACVLEMDERGEFKVPCLRWKSFSRHSIVVEPPALNSAAGAAETQWVAQDVLTYLGIPHVLPVEWKVAKKARVSRFYHCSFIKDFRQ
jgi:hypothetical protein